ncbi:hypothetical protein ACWGIR_31100 [Streptomyces albidoflavus]
MNDPWNSRLDVAEALEAAGWTGAPDRPLEILRHPNGAVWAVHNDHGDCGLDTPGGGGVTFPGDVPDTVIIAACLAAGQIGAERPRRTVPSARVPAALAETGRDPHHHIDSRHPLADLETTP